MTEDSHDGARRDVVAILVHDHREVEEMFEKLESGGIGDARNRRAVVEQVTVELVRHSAAEEQYLYPAVREYLPGGGALADREIAEHAEAERLMKELEHTDHGEPYFEELVTRLIGTVRAHIAEEEDDLFPRLTRTCDTETLLDLGDKVAAAKKIAPTRPHPSLPHTPPGNRVAGPVAGVVDRVRDALSNRATD